MISQTEEESEVHTYRGPCNQQFRVCNPLGRSHFSGYPRNYLVPTETVRLFAEIEVLSSVPS